MNTQFIKDIQKGITKEPIKQVLDPGSTDRRYEPASGLRKHRERIHKESRYVDENRNLPFTFSKPPKQKGRSNLISCDNCGFVTSGTTVTVGIVCRNCKKFSTVTEVVI